MSLLNWLRDRADLVKRCEYAESAYFHEARDHDVMRSQFAETRADLAISNAQRDGLKSQLAEAEAALKAAHKAKKS